MRRRRVGGGAWGGVRGWLRGRLAPLDPAEEDVPIARMTGVIEQASGGVVRSTRSRDEPGALCRRSLACLPDCPGRAGAGTFQSAPSLLSFWPVQGA